MNPLARVLYWTLHTVNVALSGMFPTFFYSFIYGKYPVEPGRYDREVKPMNPHELIRLVDTLHREKEIDTEDVFKSLEAALLSAARKHLGASEELLVSIDRETGEIHATDGDQEIDPSDLGRIAAQTAKQVMIQKIREAERDSISQEFASRVHTVVTGAVQRFEGPNIVVSLQRTEGFLPKSEQIFNENFHVGERLRALVLEVRAVGTRVRVVLSRTHPDFVRELFALEVPEIAEKVVEIRGLARESGYRTKVAVHSVDPRVDCVGACVGVQGSRIRSIVDELNGEKIDIVRWNEQTDQLIANTLKPAEIHSIYMDEEKRHAQVMVTDDQLSLAIGKRGQNVRLAAKLTGWDIDIKSLDAENKEEAGEEESAAPEESTEPAPDITPPPPGEEEKTEATPENVAHPPPGEEEKTGEKEPTAESKSESEPIADNTEQQKATDSTTNT